MTLSTTNGLPEHPLSRGDTTHNQNGTKHALNTMRNDTNGATGRSSPQVYLEPDTVRGNGRVLVRMSPSDEWMAASMQNHPSSCSTHAELAEMSGRFPDAFLPIHLAIGSQPNLVAPYVSSKHLKALPECTSPDIRKITSSIEKINIARTSVTDAVPNPSEVSSPLCQSNVSRTEESPAKRYAQLPILSSYADATNFAARFPELASEVLSRPLKVTPTSGFANVEQSALMAGHPKMPEHTADRPNWALAPEVTTDSNDSASIAPDEVEVDTTPDVCLSDFRQTKVSIRAPVESNSFDPESPEQSRNKRRLLRSAPCRRTHVKAANSHNRFGGMRGFGDNTQEKSADNSSYNASSPFDWTPNISRHSLPEASDLSKHPGCKEEGPTSCHAWDIIDDRSPRPKSGDEWKNPSVEPSWDIMKETVEFTDSQQGPRIDRWSSLIAHVSWDYPSLGPPKMLQSSQDLLYRSPEPSQQPPKESMQISSVKQPQTRPFVGWVSPSNIRGGIASQHHTEPPRSLQPRPQFDGANEWHTSLPLRRILPGDVGRASSTVVDSRLNDNSISPLTTPSARKSFVREVISKAEQPSESPADIIKTRIFTQSVPLSPRPVLFRADSWNSATPYTALGTNRGEGDTAEKEPPVWDTAQTEVPEVTLVTIDSNLLMKSAGHSKQLDVVVTLAPSPTPALGDSAYRSSKSGANTTFPTAGTLEHVPESEVESSVDGTAHFHILKPKEQTIHSCPVVSQSGLTPSKKRQLSSDSGDQSKGPLNASRDPVEPLAMCEAPAYPPAAETPGEGMGVVDNGLLSQGKIFLEDPEARCFSDIKASSAPERSSETLDDGPEQHLDGYAWRMGRPVSGWRRGLLDQSLSQKYIPPPARLFPPCTFREKPGLPISEQNKIYTFKLPPIAPVPRSSSQDVKEAPEAQVKQSVSKVKWEAPQHTNATSAGHNNGTFTTGVSSVPEITEVTEPRRPSSDEHTPFALRVASPLGNIDNTDTDLASSNCFESYKSPVMSFSERNVTPLEHRAISGTLPRDQVETSDLASQNSSSLLIASRSMGKENMLDGVPPSTPLSNNHMLSAPHPSPNGVDALQWPPPCVGMASSIQEHMLARQDSIAVTDYLHHPSQPPSRSSNPYIHSAQNQLPTAFVHNSTFAPIQGYHSGMSSVHPEVYRHPPMPSYFRPELTQDLVGASGWIVYPNFDGDAQYLIDERGAIDNTTLAPQNHSRTGCLPRSEHSLINNSPSQHSGSMPPISSRPNVPSEIAHHPVEEEAPFPSSGKQFVSPGYPIAPSAHSLSSYVGQYDIASQIDQKEWSEWSMANSRPIHARQNGQGYSSQNF